ncbi:hypothetical protein ACSTBC_004640 [Escherichia coli]
MWQQSGDEQHHCVYPISVVPHAMIFVTDSMTTDALNLPVVSPAS